tara:strand:+ start:158874 stop:159431 length:558 start_codon:yes stop_codon:yes gene_type:complete
MLERLFIALTLPEDTIQSLESLQTGLPDIRWTPGEQMHITLKFLGDMDEPTFEEIADAMPDLEPELPPLRIRGVGQFSHKKWAPVLWAGLEPDEPLIELNRNVESLTNLRGIAREKRAYLPHITLGRLKKAHPRRLQEYLEMHHEFQSGDFHCPELVLFSSRLSPGGAIHRPLARVDVRGSDRHA